MTFETAVSVPVPIDEVFAWHGRPGALTRLLPPWPRVRIRREASNLADGRAELVLPGGVVWVAQHQACDPPNRFVDELTSLPFRWRHEHRFESDGVGATRVIDRVDTRMPERWLRPMFTYRHRQLAGDLAAHAALRGPDDRYLTIAVTGASGLVGRALCAFLSTGGHRVIQLVRRPAAGGDERQWKPSSPAPDLLEGVDAVIHLAGASIAGRFSGRHKRDIYDSRVGPTRGLAELAGATPGGPRVFVSASAIGYYGAQRGDEVLEEDAARGDGFLADVVTRWEGDTGPAADAGLRVVNVRTGIVQSGRGGVLKALLPLFRLGLGGPLGDGTAWMSWIGLDDLLDIYLRALIDPEMVGPVNAVAPFPVRSEDYARVLGRTLHRPARLRVPSIGPRLLLGSEGASELALASQRVCPARLQRAGHTFRHPTLEEALAHQVGRIG
jgi:uncharacterized protein